MAVWTRGPRSKGRARTRSGALLTVALCGNVATLTSCGGEWEAGEIQPVTATGGSGSICPEAFDGDDQPPVASYPTGLHVVGNRIEDADGNPVVLRGVNRSGTEYQCVGARGIFDGASDEASVLAMLKWNVNAVRIPLNEACWLAINDVADWLSGDTYKTAILDYVALLHKYGIVPILDLHWAAPGELRPTNLQPMPNRDHTLDFWRDMARTFADDDGVVFEPYNEPYPDFNDDTEIAWQCWRDGCTEYLNYDMDSPYDAVGMQEIVQAIRDEGSRHLILLGGVQYSNDLTLWLDYKPDDPAENLAAAWHVYNFNECSNLTCWDQDAGAVVAEFPIVATEIGQDDCQGGFITPLMQWLDDHASGYLAWSWNAYGACRPAVRGMPGQPREEGLPWSLVASYDCPVPNGDYAAAFHAHLTGAAP